MAFWISKSTLTKRIDVNIMLGFALVVANLNGYFDAFFATSGVVNVMLNVTLLIKRMKA